MPVDLLMRADFLIPLGPAGARDRRIADGYVLARGRTLLEAGAWTADVADRLIPRVLTGAVDVIGGASPDGTPARLPGILMPALVKAHGHDHESPIIGVARDEPLADWLDHAVNLFTGFMGEQREELERAFGRSPNLVTYRKARLDDLAYGITSSMVHHCNHNKYHIEEIFEANREAGTRMIVAAGSQDRHYDDRILDTPEEALARLDEANERFGDGDMFQVIPGPDQFFSNGPDLLRALKDWADRNGTLVHIHSSEEPRTTAWFRETYGMTPVAYGESIGFLDERTILAHQVNCTGEDLEIIRRTKARVVHNPLANTILGSGMPPVIDMLEKGIPVAISTDGSGSADNQNIINAARLASQFQKALHQNARLLTAQDVLEMVTCVPAAMLGMHVGELTPGRDADFILVDTRAPNLTPTRLDNCVENLIWAANGNEVRYVVGAGRVLVDDYRFTTLDAEEIKNQVQDLSERFAKYRRTAREIQKTGARSNGQEAP